MEPNEAFIRETYSGEIHPHQVDRLVFQFRIHQDLKMTAASVKRLKKLNETPRKKRSAQSKNKNWSQPKYRSNNQNVRNFHMMLIGDISNKAGVYKIKFDSQHFYIGSTQNIGIRTKQHSGQIWKYFYTGKCYERHYFVKVFSFLQDNPNLETFEVELIEECDSKKDLILTENYWLNKNRRNKRCLNLGFPQLKIYNDAPY